jgi:hypothetical protein
VWIDEEELDELDLDEEEDSAGGNKRKKKKGKAKSASTPNERVRATIAKADNTLSLQRLMDAIMEVSAAPPSSPRRGWLLGCDQMFEARMIAVFTQDSAFDASNSQPLVAPTPAKAPVVSTASKKPKPKPAQSQCGPARVAGVHFVVMCRACACAAEPRRRTIHRYYRRCYESD